MKKNFPFSAEIRFFGGYPKSREEILAKKHKYTAIPYGLVAEKIHCSIQKLKSIQTE
jgi:hypothetical protein